MKSKWNINPQESTTIARLLSELEGVSYILDCLDEPEELEYINNLKQKYYKKYFQMLKSNQ